MRNLYMMETASHGIHRMCDTQKSRYMPLPEYSLSDDGVLCSIYGTIIDEVFMRLLIKNPDIAPETVVWLDKVQKKNIAAIPKDIISNLRKDKYITGKYPHIHLDLSIVTQLSPLARAQYIAHAPLAEEKYRNFVYSLIKKNP